MPTVVLPRHRPHGNPTMEAVSPDFALDIAVSRDDVVFEMSCYLVVCVALADPGLNVFSACSPNSVYTVGLLTVLLRGHRMFGIPVALPLAGFLKNTPVLCAPRVYDF